MTQTYVADASFDGGDLDCGNGLLLLIRKHIDPLPRGGLLEILSREISVAEDLPAWCRMTGNAFLSDETRSTHRAYLICKGQPDDRKTPALPAQLAPNAAPRPPRIHTPAPPVPPLAVMGMGSWPRPRWMVEAMHSFIEGRLTEADFQATADDAVRLCLAAQHKAGVSVLTDGEQRRDNYASFVATRLEGCQNVPLIDLLPLVDDPEHFEAELRALDIPADEVRHPGVFGKLRRGKPLVSHEVDFVRGQSATPVKVALPGPYLLTRTMWMDCISDQIYRSREEIAADIVSVLRAELEDCLAAGASLVQFDEPVLSEVVFSGAKNKRSFMCGALSESLGTAEELAFARDLLRAVFEGFPRDRIALHVCRGNWSKDESVALSGSYAPLIACLAAVDAGAYLLEMATPRAGEMDLLTGLPDAARIGIGVVNQKLDVSEAEDEVASRILQAVDLFGADRVLLHPDCGFATFADAPICSAGHAEEKLALIARVAQRYM